MVFVYGLTAEGEGIRYIGVTKRDLHTRLTLHLYGAKRGDDTHKCRWLRKCIRENRTVKIIKLTCVTKESWPEREKRFIDIASRHWKLTNSCAGGLGVLDPNETTRAKIGAASRARAPDSPETRAKKSSSRIGKKHSQETKDKIAAAHKGKPKTPEHRAACSAGQRRRTAK